MKIFMNLLFLILLCALGAHSEADIVTPPSPTSNIDTRFLKQSNTNLKNSQSNVVDLTDALQLVESIQHQNLVTRSILDSILEAIAQVPTLQCRKDLNDTLNGVLKKEPWAVAMYDASVKVPFGIEYGNVHQFGNFDQCISANLNINRDGDTEPTQATDITPQYCLASVEVEGFTVREMASRMYQMGNSTLVRWGVCMPTSCKPNDIIIFLSKATGRKNVQINKNACYANDRMEIRTIDIVYGCIILSFVLMALFCTGYHIYLSYRTKNSSHNRGCLELIIKSFSLIENAKKLVQGSKDDLGLSAVNGIKALAMTLIVAGHASLFIVGGPVMNNHFFNKAIHDVQNGFLLNSPLLVDTFFLLSGFLFARLIMIELNKRNGKINFGLLYIFRYIRLTPAYLAVIALYVTWLPKIGSGPMWNEKILLEQERCQSSWWLNLLYINNYIGTDKLCMFQSWYLAADTQLFILAPLILYPLWRWRKVGLHILGISTLVSVIIPFVLTYINNLDPSFLIFVDEAEDVSANKFFTETYIKTHMRATSYLFGIITGYLVHYMQEKNLKLPRYVVWTSWILSTIIGTVSMFSLTLFYSGEYSRFESSTYAAFHRMGWSLANSWLVLACVLGYAGSLRNLLASRGLVPFSRLTYCAYLTNGIVELYQKASLRSPKYLSVFHTLGDTISHIMLTFMTALVLCLLFESPIHGIEKILLRRESQKRMAASKQSQNSLSTSEESA